MNEEKIKLENSLADPEIYGNKDKFMLAESEYNKALSALSEANKEYEIVFEQMIELEK